MAKSITFNRWTGTMISPITINDKALTGLHTSDGHKKNWRAIDWSCDMTNPAGLILEALASGEAVVLFLSLPRELAMT
jgi:hypothetical protein